MIPQVVGREVELRAIDGFLEGIPDGARSLLLAGEAGVGKTALWETAIAAARARDFTLLVARAGQAETQLSFTTLTDLLDDVDPAVLDVLPGPQRVALQVASLRVEPSGRPPEPRAIGSGLLGTIRHLSRQRPLVVAVDDIQWLDEGSIAVLGFAARRLESEPVGWLLTERSGGGPSPFRRAFDRAGLVEVDMGGLSFGAVRHLLATRFGLRISRHTCRRIFEATAGNPLFVIEIGRALAEQALDDLPDDMSLPAHVEDLLGVRLESLRPPVRRVLLAVALNGELRIDVLPSIANDRALEDALESGLLAADGERVRLFHPLMATAVRARSSAREQRDLHLELAAAIPDETRRARHLALSTAQPDEKLAGSLAHAAAAAGARGARGDAVELARHARRLTPEDSPMRHVRLLELADALDRAGEKRQLQAMLAPEVERLPPGELRARGHLLMLGADPSIAEFEEHLERALVESADSPDLRARALAEKAIDTAVWMVRSIPASAAWAEEAVALSPTTIETLSALGWSRILGGQPIDDLLALEAGLTAPEIYYSLHRLHGIQAAFRGEVATARSTFDRLLQLADERGEDWSYGSINHQLSELALRSGALAEARERLAQTQPGAQDSLSTLSHPVRLHAMLAAMEGRPDDVTARAEEARRGLTAGGLPDSQMTWDELELRRATGLAALSVGDPSRAAQELGSVWRHCEDEGIHDPGAFPVAPDLVEALLLAMEIDEAELVTGRLDELATQQQHPWGLASVLRCRALLSVAGRAGSEDPALDLERAAAAYEALELRFDHARSVLLQGGAERRLRRWGAAATTLTRAIDAFEAMGASGWASAAREELDRLGNRARRPNDGLTRSERRVAELAAEGLSNREIAGALFVGEHTVEVHLSRAYAKLGIRSRAALARRLAEPS